MEIIEEASDLKGKTIEWAGIVSKGEAGDDVDFIMRFTDGTECKIVAWQNEGYPTEMCVEVSPSSTCA